MDNTQKNAKMFCAYCLLHYICNRLHISNISNTTNLSTSDAKSVSSNFAFQELREAKNNGTQIKIVKGTKLTTKKSLECIAIIKKHSKDFGGTLDDPDVIKLCGCSRNSYYTYKREIKEG